MSTLLKLCLTCLALTCLSATAAPACGPDSIGRRGCCSHHGGVCGCHGAKQRCCDGSDSPTCLCGE